MLNNPSSVVEYKQIDVYQLNSDPAYMKTLNFLCYHHHLLRQYYYQDFGICEYEPITRKDDSFHKSFEDTCS